MKNTSPVALFFAFVIVVSTAMSVAAQGMAQYAAPIVYKQTITTIVDAEDTTVPWPLPAGTTLYRGFSTLASSGDGSKVAFRVCDLNYGGEGCRVLLVNADGSSLQDISTIFPPNLVSTSWSWGNLRINDDGSKVFIRAQLDDSKSYIYEYDVASGATGLAVSDWWWSSQFDWFAIDDDASRFFEGKYDAGYDPAAGRNIRGLYRADYGSTRQQYVDIYADLPCNGSCNNLNMVRQLGGSADGSRAFFRWMSDYLGNSHPDNRSAMWKSVLPHTVSKLTADDHYWVWDGDIRGICDQTGAKALYQYRHLSGDPKVTDLVDVATGTSTQLTWTDDYNPVHGFITRSGDYVMLWGEKGDVGSTQYLTLVDLDLGLERDTWSYFLPPVGGDVSKITNDDGTYFVTNDVNLQRVDMAVDQTADYSQAPNITGIAFTSPYLWHEDGVEIGVTVSVTDSQGLGDIATVTLAVLVEGVEEPIWSMPREPLAFPSGDPGATLLYDDGTNGDVTAGDGIFSYNAIATRKTDPITWNTWYSNFTLPHQVGVRILAEDVEGNATIADTNLWITAVDANPVEIFADGFEAGNTSGWSSTTP